MVAWFKAKYLHTNNNTIKFFVEMNCRRRGAHAPRNKKDKKKKTRQRLGDFSRKINTEVHHVVTSHKIRDELKGT